MAVMLCCKYCVAQHKTIKRNNRPTSLRQQHSSRSSGRHYEARQAFAASARLYTDQTNIPSPLPSLRQLSELNRQPSTRESRQTQSQQPSDVTVIVVDSVDGRSVDKLKDNQMVTITTQTTVERTSDGATNSQINISCQTESETEPLIDFCNNPQQGIESILDAVSKPTGTTPLNDNSTQYNKTGRDSVTMTTATTLHGSSVERTNSNNNNDDGHSTQSVTTELCQDSSSTNGSTVMGDQCEDISLRTLSANTLDKVHCLSSSKSEVHLIELDSHCVKKSASTADLSDTIELNKPATRSLSDNRQCSEEKKELSRELWNLRAFLAQEEQEDSETSRTAQSSVQRDDDETKNNEGTGQSDTNLQRDPSIRRQTFRNSFIRRMKRLEVSRQGNVETSSESAEITDTDASLSVERSTSNVNTFSVDSTSGSTESEEHGHRLEQLRADSGYKSLETQQSLGILEIRQINFYSHTPNSIDQESKSATARKTLSVEIPVSVMRKQSLSSLEERSVRAARKRILYKSERQLVQLHDSISDSPEIQPRLTKATSAGENVTLHTPRSNYFSHLGVKGNRRPLVRVRRDYSIDEKTDSLFNEFNRHDPHLEIKNALCVKRHPRRHRHRISRGKPVDSTIDNCDPKRLPHNDETHPGKQQINHHSHHQNQDTLPQTLQQQMTDNEQMSVSTPTPELITNRTTSSEQTTEEPAADDTNNVSSYQVFNGRIPLINLPEDDMVDS